MHLASSCTTPWTLTKSLRCRAQTRPSPPLLPGPQITSTEGVAFTREVSGYACKGERRRDCHKEKILRTDSLLTLGWCLTLVTAVAQLSPASSISWSTLKPYSLKSSSSMCWASSCLRTINSLQSAMFFNLGLYPTRSSHDRIFFYPRYLIVLAMVDADLLPKQSFFLRLAAVDNGHVPVWARTTPTLDVTRKPIPKRVLTLHIQTVPNCWHKAGFNKVKILLRSQA